MISYKLSARSIVVKVSIRKTPTERRRYAGCHRGHAGGNRTQACRTVGRAARAAVRARKPATSCNEAKIYTEPGISGARGFTRQGSTNVASSAEEERSR